MDKKVVVSMWVSEWIGAEIMYIFSNFIIDDRVWKIEKKG